MVLTVVIAIFVLALCVAGLGISILSKKEGTFPITEVSANPKIRKLGLRCPKEEEMQRCVSCAESCKKSIYPKDNH